MTQAIGALMLVAFFAGVLWKFSRDFGVRDTVVVWGGAVLAAAWIVLAVALLTGRLLN